MNHDAIVFDLDGTLLDSLRDIAEAGNRVLGQFGFPPHPVDRYRTMVGDGVEVILPTYMDRFRAEGKLSAVA